MTRQHERYFYCAACRRRFKASARQFHYASKAHREAKHEESRQVRKEIQKRLERIG